MRRSNEGIADRVYRCLLDIDEREGLHLRAFTPTEHVPALVDRFPAAEFYMNAEAAREAVETRGQFHIIHPSSGLKVDVFVNKNTDYDRLRLDRRQRLPLVPGREAYFARPEDIILYKMLYFREGQSDVHVRDILGILRVAQDPEAQGEERPPVGRQQPLQCAGVAGPRGAQQRRFRPGARVLLAQPHGAGPPQGFLHLQHRSPFSLVSLRYRSPRGAKRIFLFGPPPDNRSEVLAG